MSAISSRTMIVKRNAIAVAGVRTKSITIGGSVVDVTTDDDAGVRALLSSPGQVDVDIKVSGILLNNTLRAEALQGSNRVATMVFESGSASPTGGFSGSFFMDSYEEAGDYQAAGTFTASFKSTGAVTYLG